mgnify:CR=1 FL=1
MSTSIFSSPPLHAPQGERIPAKSGSQAAYKEMILVLAMAVANGVAFFLWKMILPDIVSGQFTGYINFIYPVAALLASAVLFSLAALFIKKGFIIYPAAIVALGASYLLVPATNFVLGALGVSLIIITLAVHRIRHEFLFSLGFGASRILKVGLPLYFTSTALLFSIFYIELIDQKGAARALVPKSALDFTLKYFLESDYMQSLTGLPGITRDSTVNEVIDGLIKEELKNQAVSSSEVSVQDLEKLRATQREDLARQYGIALSGEEKLGDVLYIVIAERVEELLGPYKQYLPVVVFLTFFFAFKAFTFPLYFIALFFTYLLIKLLIFAKIINTSVYQIEVEKLSL